MDRDEFLMGADSACAGFTARQGEFTNGQNKKGQRKEIKSMKNRILMAILPVLACFALLPGAQAVSPAPDGCYPNYTTAEGCNALQFLGAGFGNTGVGWYSLYLAGDSNYNTGVGGGALALNTGDDNTAVGAAALLLNTDGTDNTAVGTDALVNNTAGTRNCAFGSFALYSNQVSGNGSNAFGFEALYNNDSDGAGLGLYNNGFGWEALFSNVDGVWNTAMGDAAGFGIMGSYNTAIGADAMGGSSTGTENTVVGFNAGNDIATGTGNIYLGVRAGNGVGDEFAFIRIGEPTPPIVYDTYIQGIYGRFVSGTNLPVIVDSDGKLGTAVSSRRFKHDIKPMDKTSEAILALKPVTFHYNSDAKNTPAFGLIAEDVAQVNPDLVVRDKEGKPFTVRYNDVNVMLLNEFLKEHKRVEEQQASISQLKSEMQTMVVQLKEQAAQIQKVSAQLEMSKPAVKVVVKKP